MPQPHSPPSNQLIHGDNLKVLKALQTSHLEQVQCLILDPPKSSVNKRSSLAEFEAALDGCLSLAVPLLRASGVFCDDATHLGANVERHRADNLLNTVILKTSEPPLRSANASLFSQTEYLLVFIDRRVHILPTVHQSAYDHAIKRRGQQRGDGDLAGRELPRFGKSMATARCGGARGPW